MYIERINFERSLEIKEKIYIDVRSPLEFHQDNIPDSVNIPLLDNKERELIGVTYKKMEVLKQESLEWI